MKRSSGILMPLSSLPSRYGIGTVGKSAYEFIDFLKESGQTYWQFLPLGPAGSGDSPYSSFSSFAGSPCCIDLDMLAEDGLLKDSELTEFDWGEDSEKTDYEKVNRGRRELLHIAYERGREKYKEEILAFRTENSGWIENYALYMAVKSRFNMAGWSEWPEDIRLRRPEAVEKYSELCRSEVDYNVFVQYLFYSQWEKLRSYAGERGIRFIGDIPIYVPLDSADVWSEAEFFQLDEENVPTEVAGVPPDAFSEDGQLWGNPIYDWERMEEDGFGWWIRRIDGARKLYDVIRIDHFRGLESYWAVRRDAENARSGMWKPGPGMKLVGVLTSWFPDIRYIAEDLGVITQGVRQLLQDSGLPGMKVLHFAFDCENDSDYLPHNCTQNSVCYIGTHDNETTMGWAEKLSGNDRKFAEDYMHITPDEGWCWGLIRTGMSTASGIFIMQMQDVLELPAECRMNRPGVPTGNWRWRMLPGALSKELAQKLRGYTQRYRRI